MRAGRPGAGSICLHHAPRATAPGDWKPTAGSFDAKNECVHCCLGIHTEEPEVAPPRRQRPTLCLMFGIEETRRKEETDCFKIGSKKKPYFLLFKSNIKKYYTFHLFNKLLHQLFSNHSCY